jgi:tripartite-type tricarboxylate transporter receptor subunit TctC
MQEFAALARSQPNKMSFATPGVASQGHLVIAQWAALAGVTATQIPYRGGAPAMLATISGETQFTVMSSLLAAPQLQAGKLRALAIGSLKRDPDFPDVPTLAETGYPGLEAVTWVGVFAPAETPPTIVERLNRVIDRIIHEPEVAANLAKQGIVVEGGPPSQLSQLVTDEIARWSAIADRNQIRVER